MPVDRELGRERVEREMEGGGVKRERGREKEYGCVRDRKYSS